MMKNNKNISNNAKIQASQWIARENSGDMSRTKQAELDVWLAADIAHQQAYLDICKTSVHLDLLVTKQGKQDLGAVAPELQNLLDECDNLNALAKRKSGPVMTYRWISAVAASLLILAVSAMLIFQSKHSATIYETQIGGFRTVMLKDGSIITLNTDTRIFVALSGAERRVLLEHGEAYFDVAKDKTRPFIVTIGKDTVRAVGTAFNIKRRADITKVTVMEGIVEVKSTPHSGALNKGEQNVIPALLNIGGNLTITPAGIHTSMLAPSEIERTASWRTRMIHFDGKRLDIIAKELQYYTNKEIIIAGDQVGSLIVGGAFDTNNVSSFLKGLEHSFPIKVIERDTVIILKYTKKNNKIIHAIL